jgi:putative hemolysin
MFIESLLLPIFFLIGSVSFSILSKSIQTLGKLGLKKEIGNKNKKFFFYFFVKKIFFKDGWNSIRILNNSTKLICTLLYSVSFFLYFLIHPSFKGALETSSSSFTADAALLLTIFLIIVTVSLIVDFLGTLLGRSYPKSSLKVIYPLASIYLILFCPITFIILKIYRAIFLHETEFDSEYPYKIKDKILELVMESELHHQLSVQDKKLMISVASFKDRIAREIMVPRIDIIMLSSESTVEEAAKNFVAEGYSRIPVYKTTLDNITGVLLYKDLLNVYLHKPEEAILKSTSIESLIKPVVYTPETKKISILLQEMKAKQIHMAIVVDEYGGTEGIVTIEDILEELVGEIADEYDDLQQEVLFKPHPQGGWIVDAKMNIIDIEKEMAILIPQSPEYDTLGGYIFHRAGAIPTKGWKIHHENFDLEILKTSDRSVEKVRIISLQTEDL